MLRVRAVGGLRPKRVDEHGNLIPGRYYGCDVHGVALPHGELVPDCIHVRRRIRSGALEVCDGPPEVPTTPLPAPSEAPPAATVATPDGDSLTSPEARNA